MMNNKISIIHAKVGHSRLWPKKNKFLYRVFYVRFLVQKDKKTETPFLFSFDRFNLLSLFAKDYTSSKQTSLYEFISSKLKESNYKLVGDDVVELITMPRVFGFGFNPISFWLVTDRGQGLKAVFCEVTSTFRQRHNYLLYKQDGSNILPSDVLKADKKLYVSPFNKIEGHYEFNFECNQQLFKSKIRYYDSGGRQILDVFSGGKSKPLSSFGILKTLLAYPFMTFLVVMKIHWQALKLFIKIVKPTLSTKPKYYHNDRTTTGN